MQIVKLLYTRTYFFVQALIEMITGSCTRARRQIFGRPCYLFLTPWGWLGLWTWHHTWRRQWLGCVHYTEWEGDSYTELPPRFTAFVHFFLIIFLFHVIRRFNELVTVHWCDQGHSEKCLGYIPELAYDLCRVPDQGTSLHASDSHNALASILNPFNEMCKSCL